MLIQLKEDLYGHLIAYSRGTFPEEACGVILGCPTEHDADVLYATTFIPLPNVAEQPTREFTMDPMDILPYLKPGPTPLIGLFHSHPSAPPIPSCQDLQTLWHTIPTHWILSLQHQTAPELQIYQIKKAASTEYRKLPFALGQ
ncbi:M67 family metallopeptidase [Paenibacillus ferrarius]|uniref:M67 family metallopeptidase n=1 Tax=Paenibacillus ferrarius TaxID=1469647 RepID=UPI003D2BB840